MTGAVEDVLDRGVRGERALWLAVLEDAVRLYVGGDPRASAWLFGEGSGFAWVCEILGLEPFAVRRQILARKVEQNGAPVVQADLFAGRIEPLDLGRTA